MKNKLLKLTDNPLYGLIIIIILLLISRIPFINSSYGVDPDAWRIILAAINIHANGEYFVSRFPGYPLIELLYSMLLDFSPWTHNFISCLVSGLGAAAVFLIAFRLNHKNPMLCAIAYLFIPIVYVNSTIVMDYNWSISFVLLSVYFIFSGRFFWAGITLGLAVGCRITSVVVLVPAALYLYSIHKENRIKNILHYLLSAILFSGLCYLPAISKYGLGFFTYYPSELPWLVVLEKFSIGVWGGAGCVVVFVLCIVCITNFFRKNSDLMKSVTSEKKFLYSLMILFFIVYIRLPIESGYLIPVAAVFIILLFSSLNALLAWLVVFSLVFSSFFKLGKDGISFDGVIADFDKKEYMVQQLNKMVALKSQDKKCYFVVAQWFPAVSVFIAREYLTAGKAIPKIPNLGIAHYQLDNNDIIYRFRIQDKTLFPICGSEYVVPRYPLWH